MAFKTSTTIYQIMVDENSASYQQSKAEVEIGRSKTPIWNKIRVSDWHIDRCFNDINDRLTNIPGCMTFGKKDFDDKYAKSIMMLQNENLHVVLRKDMLINDNSDEPVIVLECSIPFSLFKKNLPNYISEIVDNYKAIPVKK